MQLSKVVSDYESLVEMHEEFKKSSDGAVLREIDALEHEYYMLLKHGKSPYRDIPSNASETLEFLHFFLKLLFEVNNG
jgi:hypothetical protein